MQKASVLALVALIGVGSAVAQDRPLVCFGNEPSWSVALLEPGVARLTFPDAPAVSYRGSGTRLAHLGEWVWRGKPADGAGGELVAFLRESTCSDGMSDAKHPVEARVSLADGRFFAGCCRIAGTRGEGLALAPPAIDGTTWRLTRLPGKDARALASSSRPLTVRFEAGRISGFSGCNRFMGGYTLDRDRVTIGPLAASMMACGDEATALEKAVQDGLAGTHRFTVAADGLTLTADSGAALVFQAEAPPRLEGGSWKILGFNNGRDAVVSPLADTRPTMTFEGGTVTGETGCNRFRAGYSVAGNRVTIGTASLTRMVCPGKGVMEQEQEILAALASTTTWTVEGGILDMHRPDGQRTLNASAEGPRN
jgi:heat shock protein HslJ